MPAAVVGLLEPLAPIVGGEHVQAGVDGLGVPLRLLLPTLDEAVDLIRGEGAKIDADGRVRGPLLLGLHGEAVVAVGADALDLPADGAETADANRLSVPVGLDHQLAAGVVPREGELHHGLVLAPAVDGVDGTGRLSIRVGETERDGSLIGRLLAQRDPLLARGEDRRRQLLHLFDGELDAGDGERAALAERLVLVAAHPDFGRHAREGLAAGVLGELADDRDRLGLRRRHAEVVEPNVAVEPLGDADAGVCLDRHRALVQHRAPVLEVVLGVGAVARVGAGLGDRSGVDRRSRRLRGCDLVRARLHGIPLLKGRPQKNE